jgi:hypothetical protein
MSNDHPAAMRTGAAAFLAVLAFAAAAESTPEPHLRNFGPFGVTRRQVARLNVANATIGNPNEGPACEVDLAFLDADGHTMMRVHKTVAAGASAFLDFTPPPERDAPATGIAVVPSRRTLRGLVLVQPPPERDAPAPTCVTTLEVFDAATGRTHVLLGGPDTVPALGGPDTIPAPVQ